MINDKCHIHYWGKGIIVLVDNQQFHFNEIQKEILFKIHNKNISMDRYCTGVLESNTGYKNFYNQLNKYNILSEYSTGKFTTSGEEGMFYPLKLNIQITDKCNLQCKHCYMCASPKNKEFLSKKKLNKLLKELKNKIYTIQITGGEPMLHKNFFDIAKICKESCSYLTLTTTGMLINKKNVEKLRIFSDIQLSLHSHQDFEHDYLTGAIGSRKRVIKGIHLLKKIGYKNISISHIVTNNNYLYLNQILEFAKYFNIPNVSFGLMSKLGRGKNLDKTYFLTESNIEYVTEELDQYKKLYSNINFSDWHSIDNDFNKIASMPCEAGTLMWVINESGNIIPCEYFTLHGCEIGHIDNIDSLVKSNPRNKVVNSTNKLIHSLEGNVLEPNLICEKIKMIASIE